MAKVDKTVPLVNKEDVLQAYRRLPTNAKQELLTIIDAQLVSRVNEIHKEAKRDDILCTRQQPKSKRLVGLSAFYLFNSTKLMQGILDPSGAQALAHDRSIKPDVLQPKYHTVLNETLLPFIQDRCEDFLANAKRMRSRIVRRTELWYRLTDFAMEDPRYVSVDGIVAQALEFRILSEYYRDKFESIRSKYSKEPSTLGEGSLRKSNGSVSTAFEDQRKRKPRLRQSERVLEPKATTIAGLENRPTLPPLASTRSESLNGNRLRDESPLSSHPSSSRTSSPFSSSSSSSAASFLFSVMMTSEGYTSDTSMSSPFSDSESGVGVNSNEAPKVPLEPVEGSPLMITYGQESSSNDEWHVVGEAKTRKNSPIITKVSSLLSPRRLARRRAAAKEAAASLQSTKPDEETVAVAKAKEHSDELQSRPGNIEGILSVKRTFICFEEEPTDECLCYHPPMLSKEAPF